MHYFSSQVDPEQVGHYGEHCIRHTTTGTLSEMSEWCSAPRLTTPMPPSIPSTNAALLIPNNFLLAAVHPKWREPLRWQVWGVATTPSIGICTGGCRTHFICPNSMLVVAKRKLGAFALSKVIPTAWEKSTRGLSKVTLTPDSRRDGN